MLIPLVRSKEMVMDAFQQNFAVGTFPAYNWEIIQDFSEAADELKEPVILQTAPSTIVYTAWLMS
ncbi:class II fructose-bisphosphate aldolase [Fictibacillus terranigra]|uniref:Class II fructose-bisphosphate aldolase n=1 Tax=Fictibacillus terranigra TaxID=3058424 RepID=A0ABT8E916_9BACL|nr:class II fructose-bisphosphate aldolase [Fictibacillus sp. CENA-BCM004]MDN4074402.1 class II fructose-bisphosphate aldolase [Fictibacillus sp. CENA-BCM004]